MSQNPLLELESLGQSIWMDFIRRGTITSGQLQRWITGDGVSGVTSNPSIFEKAIAGSHDYDEAMRVLALEGKNVIEMYEALTVADIRRAADLFRPVYEKTGGADGFVSIEVTPGNAHNTKGTIEEARRLWSLVGRPNVMVKVPATKEGLPAIRQLTGEGININITLLFGLPRYREVIDSYLGGLEDLEARTLDKDVDHARQVLQSLPELDIDIDVVTQQLEDEGVEKFVKAYDQLAKTLEQRRTEALHEPTDRQDFQLGGYTQIVQDRISAMQNERFSERLWRKDASLWKHDEQDQQSIRNAFGWLHVAEKMEECLEDLSDSVKTVKSEPGIQEKPHTPSRKTGS